MKRSIYFLIILIASNSQILKAAEQLFTVKVPGYTRDGLPCETRSQEIGKKFALATGTKVISTKCVYEKWYSYDFEIGYSAEKPVEIFLSSPWPIYGKVAECNANLKKDETEFTTVTGLVPFFSYCQYYYSENGEINNRFSRSFFTIGKPKLVTKSLSFNIQGGLYLGDQAKTNEFVSKSNQVGIPATQAFIDGRGYEASLWIRFMLNANQTVSLARNYLMQHDIEKDWFSTSFFETANPLTGESSAQCLRQQEIANETFKNAFTGPVVWFCIWDPALFRTHLYHLRIKPGPESFEKLVPGEDSEPFENKYVSNAACEADKSRILTRYKDKFGDRLVGALCSWPLQAKPHISVKMFIYVIED